MLNRVLLGPAIEQKERRAVQEILDRAAAVENAGCSPTKCRGDPTADRTPARPAPRPPANPPRDSTPGGRIDGALPRAKPYNRDQLHSTNSGTLEKDRTIP